MAEILEDRVQNLESFLDREISPIEKLSKEKTSTRVQKQEGNQNNKNKNEENSNKIEINKEENSNEPLLEDLSKLEEIISKLEKKYEKNLTPFHTNYKKFKGTLKKDISSLFLDTSTKTNIILTSEKTINEICKDLEEIKHSEYVIGTTAQKYFGDSKKNLHQANLTYFNQLEEVNSQSLQLDTLISSYNRVIEMISQKFIQMDAILTEYEKSFKK
ncbi:dynactin subunit 3 [Anaeramoeba flamelloides]|uniref:Dynactin subunit 3 n=1 Tax=Anaeramoeba flamelloides TaxID=1746091 RepID=A0ABQ8XB09_9EUKA|nr:dynactin subunit 3 [Anaeramoeba flamelloides]